MNEREASIALYSALASWASFGLGWWLAYSTSIPVAGAQALLLASCVIGFVLDVLAIAYAKRVREATKPGDPLRQRVGLAAVMAWISLVVLVLLGMLALWGPTYQ